MKNPNSKIPEKQKAELVFVLQQLAKIKTEVRTREDAIKEKQQFLEQEIENNTEQEKKIAVSERIASKLRMEYQEAEAMRDQFQSEVSLRNLFLVKFNIIPLSWQKELFHSYV